ERARSCWRTIACSRRIWGCKAFFASGAHVHRPSAQSDIERVPPKHINSSDEQQQDRCLPSLGGVEKLRFSKNHNHGDRQGHQENHSVHYANELFFRRVQRKRDREELKGNVDKRQPSQIEAQPVRRKQPEWTFPVLSVKEEEQFP